MSGEGTTPGTNPSSMSNNFNYIPDLELDDQIIHCWAGISNAMHTGNEKLFRSRKHTTDIIQSGKYTNLLRDFQPILKDWWKEFERFRLPTFIRHILTIEYEYVRIYINSLSLQAVVERCTSNAGNTAAPQHCRPQTQNYYGKLPLGQIGGFGAADQEYVKEVVDGSRNLAAHRCGRPAAWRLSQARPRADLLPHHQRCHVPPQDLRPGRPQVGRGDVHLAHGRHRQRAPQLRRRRRAPRHPLRRPPRVAHKPAPEPLHPRAAAAVVAAGSFFG